VRFGVTGSAKGHEIIVSVGTAPVNGEYMMDNIGGDEAVGQKALFAERVLGDI